MPAPEARRVGHHALLLECGSTDAVRAVHAAALERREAGLLRCVDVVPGATTVLLDGVASPEEVRSGLGGWELRPVADLERRVVELPTAYDGPDLEDVARLCGLDVDGLVARHRAAELVVAFCGFAPGFAYLAGLPAELHVPRRDEPRSRVPQGAVGLAGEFCGVYPRSSPGGWQLVGRTEVSLWDAARDEPALLLPGTTVRFTGA